jgi:SAM-dependent methyltransferase
MQYDPIKRALGTVFNRSPLLRIVFYGLLDLLLLRSWYVRRALRQLLKTVPQDAEILDAGSGFGQYVWRVSQLGDDYKILGVDVKQEQINDCNAFFAKKKLSDRVRFQVADLTTFKQSEKFHLILSVDVMEHITEDELVMRNMYDSLKPEGILIISTPSDKGGSDTHHHHEEDGIKGFIDEHVRDGYNIEDIRVKLTRAGFNQIDTRYSYGLPGNIAWRLTMKYPIVILNISKLFFILLPFYYLLVWPVAYILNHLDVRRRHTSGTGLLVTAIK